MDIQKRGKGEIMIIDEFVACVVHRKILYVSADVSAENMKIVRKYESQLLKEKKITGSNYEPFDFIDALMRVNMQECLTEVKK